jgi:mRNA interferase YafQ
MRTIERTNVFKRDFKREKSGQHRRDLDALVFTAISLLAEDMPVPEKNRDHALGANGEITANATSSRTCF